MNDNIPMTTPHQILVLSGRKTTTLRGVPFSAGRHYRMVTRQNLSLGMLEVLRVDNELTVWTELEPEEQIRLATTEGYATVDEFKTKAARIPGVPAFFEGRRGMYLHHIKAVEVKL